MFLLALLAVVYIALVVLVELEHFGWSTSVLVGAVAYLHYCGLINVGLFIQTGGLGLLLYALYYILAGVAWSGFKWLSFSFAFRDYYRKFKKEYYEYGSENRSAEGFKGYLLSKSHYLPARFKGNVLGQAPQFSDNKGRAVAWAAYWPVSMVGTLLNDPVRRIINFILNRLEKTYQKVSDNIWKDEF